MEQNKRSALHILHCIPDTIDGFSRHHKANKLSTLAAAEWWPPKVAMEVQHLGHSFLRFGLLNDPGFISKVKMML